MKKLFAAILILAFSGASFAQPDTLWTRTFGGYSSDGGWSVQQTYDEGYIISGYSDSYGVGATDVWLIKTDANGDTVWTKTYGGWTGEHGFSVHQTQDSGYIVVGLTHSFGAGGGDIYLLRTDKYGDTLWARTFGGTLYDRAQSVCQAQDGNYIVAGYTSSFGAGGNDIWLIKIDTNGDTLWTKTYGGPSTDEAYSVQETEDSGCIIVGRTFSFGAGNGDIWLVRINSNGDTLWTKTYGGSGREEGRSVQETQDDGFVIVGFTESFGAGGADIYVIKTDSIGDTLWTRTFGGTDKDEGYSIRQTSDGGHIIAGSTKSFGAGNKDAWLIRTDAKGDTLWTMVLGGPDREEVYDIDITSDGGYVITGRTASFGVGTSDNVWLVKTGTDPAGIEETENVNLPEVKIRNYPNPFSQSTAISYQLSTNSVVSLQIYSVTGQLIKTLVSMERRTGKYVAIWNGRDEKGNKVASGIYFCRLKGGGIEINKKMVFIK